MIQSKLPNIGTNIFTVMSQLAAEHNAVNLSQGFPDYPVDTQLLDLVNFYHTQNYHQYAPMIGIEKLRNSICNIYKNEYEASYEVDSEILITNGASEALFSSIAAIINFGDEAIIFEPAYDLYAPTIQLFGGNAIPISTYAPDFKINWEEVNQKVSSKTKLIIINNPNNPTGKLWSNEDFKALINLVNQHPQIIIISDEVYGFITLNDEKFISISSIEQLKSRSIITASFGKLLHATGWKIGYCLAPNSIMKEIRKVHQYNVFTVNHALQYAIADYIQDEQVYKNLHDFFQPKYNLLKTGLASLGFEILKTDATYFLTAKYHNISNKSDVDFSKYLIEKYKVATIPISAFYHDQHDDQLIRFCFAKKEETLHQALNNLAELK